MVMNCSGYAEREGAAQAGSRSQASRAFVLEPLVCTLRQEGRKKLMLWPGLLALAVGLVVTATSTALLLRRRRILTQGILVDGTVVGFRESEQTFAPIVEFTTRTGTIKRWNSPVFASSPHFRLQETVPIVYDSEHSERAVIPSYGVYTPVWGIVCMAFGLGLLNLIPGVHFHPSGGDSAVLLPLELMFPRDVQRVKLR